MKTLTLFVIMCYLSMLPYIQNTLITNILQNNSTISNIQIADFGILFSQKNINPIISINSPTTSLLVKKINKIITSTNHTITQ